MELQSDIVVVGASLGGVAAALAAAKLGATVILTEETDWLGGQATAQGIPPDEHPWIESTGATRAYREFRERVRDHYRRNYPLTARYRFHAHLNPGLGNVGPLCHEPRVGELILREMLSRYVARGKIEVLFNTVPERVEMDRDRCHGVVCRRGDGEEVALTAAVFLDATDLGDVIELGDVEHRIGAESQKETGELHALEHHSDPFDQQALTWMMALEFCPGEDHTISRPGGYERWRVWEPECWVGPMFSWTVSDFVTHEPRHRPLFLDERLTAGTMTYDLWHARRILSSEVFEEDYPEVTAAAWPQMDYWAKPLLGVPDDQRMQALAEARDFTLSFLYWMQIEAPRVDGGTGYPELRLRGDVVGTPDGLAKMPYVRESRRIVAESTVLEQHIGVEARNGLEGAKEFSDSVGIGAYRIDLHPSTSGRNTVDIDSWPFQIPLGALLPVRVENILPACKNIGTTHITNGAYRVHPVEWAIGEATGALAAFSLRKGAEPRQVRAERALLEEFQGILTLTLGAPIAWPRYEALTPTRRFGYIPAGEQSSASSVRHLP